MAYKKNAGWANEVLKSVARDLAIGAASLINALDPEAIIFGGGIFSDGGGPLIPWIKEEIKDRCFKSSQRNLQILAASCGGDAGVLGAASLVFKAFE